MSDEISTEHYPNVAAAVFVAVSASVRLGGESIRLVCTQESRDEAEELLGHACTSDYAGAFSTEFFGDRDGAPWSVRTVTQPDEDSTP